MRSGVLGTAGTWSLELLMPVNDLLGENSCNRKGAGEEAAVTSALQAQQVENTTTVKTLVLCTQI